MEIIQVPLNFKDTPAGIAAMAQDNQGNIWMADKGRGLFKYDGVNLIRYGHKPIDSNSLPSDRLECITTSPDGIVWIGTFLNGLVRFDPMEETFVTYQHDDENPNSIRSNSIHALVTDKRGGVWIGTNEGLDYLNPESGNFQHTFSSEPDEVFLQRDHVRKLYIDKAGVLWIGCGSPFDTEDTEGGLFRLDAANKNVTRYVHNTSSNSLVDNRVRAIYEDSKGNFWVGTVGDGLHTMNRTEGTFNRHSYNPKSPEKLSRPPLGNLYNYAEDHIVFISEDAKGFIWIATFEGGINRYDPGTKTVKHFGVNETGIYKLPTNSFWCGLQTRDNLLWITSWEAQTPFDQLLKINPVSRHITNVTLNKTIYSFAEGDGNTVYMGSTNEILKVDSTGHAETVVRISDQDSSRPIYNLEKDTDGNLWISSRYGLHHFNVNTKTLKAFEYDNLGTSDFAITTRQINKDSLLIGTNTGLLLLDLSKGRFSKFPYINPNTGLTENLTIRKIVIDSEKNIWILANDHFAMRLLVHTGSYIEYNVKNVVEHTHDIFENTDKSLFFGNWRSGFKKYNAKNDKFENITDQIGILNHETQVFSIQSEGDNILWLESANGFIKFDMSSKAASIYGKSWGFDPGFFVWPGLFFKSKEGEYYKGTTSGYIKFHPSNFERKIKNSFPPFINKLMVENKILATPTDSINEIELAYDQNNLKLELGYVNFESDQTEQYLQYQLVGYDEAWRNGSSGEIVSYQKLDPGKYIFNLKAMDKFGEWSDTAMAIVIIPPWWQTFWAYSAYGIIFIGSVFLVDRFQRKRLLAQANAKARAKELEQAREIEKAYKELKATQSQLIQSEKMASLGELTAGIAHEIQNPLNFVNNFSEVNTELIKEIQDERRKTQDERDEKLENDLLQDISLNQEKINHHGKRASDIVKGMLQHSRSSSGVKEPTDINALADEYLRLAYHGLRAKDKSFNATMKTDFDQTIGNINIVPQDIGRVILNLITNAFYVVNEKNNVTLSLSKRDTLRQAQGDSYEPTVSVITKKEGNKVLISVKDNGNGIPQKILDKIFQPFFTTKPTGQGTGLGLSLSYDIVKAHGGELKVETKEGEGSEFIIVLPAV